MQWDNFRLLLLEGLSQGADSLIVGDVKQSIYRWRNGDWGILNGLKTNIEAFPVKVKTLTTNRRSAANIIHFNNEVFTAACEVLNNIYKEEQKRRCKELKEAYNDVCQETYKDPGKRVCQSGISIGYGRHDLYGKHPAPPRRRSGAACGAGRATERYCHPGAQEQKHSFNSRLLRQEHLLQNRIR